jgi:small redox-active disulfide protein 2
VIKILGSGCAKCNELERVTRQAAADLGLPADIEHVSDFAEIVAYGVMSTPALVVDGQVKLAGRVPKVDDVARLLQGASTGATGGGCACSGGCC